MEHGNFIVIKWWSWGYPHSWMVFLGTPILGTPHVSNYTINCMIVGCLNMLCSQRDGMKWKVVMIMMMMLMMMLMINH